MSELKDQYGGHWGEHPDWPAADWAIAAREDETRLGYWDWVEAQIDLTDDNEDAEQPIEESS